MLPSPPRVYQIIQAGRRLASHPRDKSAAIRAMAERLPVESVARALIAQAADAWKAES